MLITLDSWLCTGISSTIWPPSSHDWAPDLGLRHWANLWPPIWQFAQACLYGQFCLVQSLLFHLWQVPLLCFFLVLLVTLLLTLGLIILPIVFEPSSMLLTHRI